MDYRYYRGRYYPHPPKPDHGDEKAGEYATPPRTTQALEPTEEASREQTYLQDVIAKVKKQGVTTKGYPNPHYARNKEIKALIKKETEHRAQFIENSRKWDESMTRQRKLEAEYNPSGDYKRIQK